MAAPTRDRGCFYYLPKIMLFCLSLLGAGVGIWTDYGMKVYNKTKAGLDVLGVDAYNIERSRPAIIATGTTALFIVVLMAAMSFARSFIEAAHDATGLSGGGSFAWLVLNVLIAVPWWIITIWLVFLIMGHTVWAGLLYVFTEVIDNLRGGGFLFVWNRLKDKYGLQPAVIWLPSANQTCPRECLDLTQYSFISTAFANSCVCDYSRLKSATDNFSEAYRWSAAALAGVWIMFLSALFLMVNFACQFSHTIREREYIRRLTQKQFIGF